jgi:succinate dehydrogenase / fumarate reductase flavoprotein subunit
VAGAPQGRGFANPCYTQIHPTCIPQADDTQSKLTLMSESLRNDGRVWVPKNAATTPGPPDQIPEDERDYYLERLYPSFGNLAPRDISSRAAKRRGRRGPRRRPAEERRLPRLRRRHRSPRRRHVRERYGNLFEMYERITGETRTSSRCASTRPPLHDGWPLGGLRADDHGPGLYAAGEANFSDHGANRLGASALMQGLADGYFVLPYTIGNYLAPMLGKPSRCPPTTPSSRRPRPAARQRFDRASSTSAAPARPTTFHRELGKIMWDYCGMERTEEGLEKALRAARAARGVPKDLRVTGAAVHQPDPGEGRPGRRLLRARPADVPRRPRAQGVCGGHFRAEYQTDEGEAERDDEHFAHVAAWEWTGDPMQPNRHIEPLEFDNVHLAVRSYK